jgi:hypothetical protein
MNWSFYDVKAREKVETEVTGKKVYGEGKQERYAFKGQTKDGRSLTAFVGKADFDKCKATILK